MATARAVALLALMGMPGHGRVRALRLVPDLDGSPVGPRPPGALVAAVPGREAELDGAWRVALAAVRRCSDLGATVLARGEEGYPARLDAMPDPPAVLHVLGDRAALARDRAVAVVGTREPTPYGAEVARRCGASSARDGLVVVSGLAVGIDQAAHEGCVGAGGTAVAVMAHGLHDVQPRSAGPLAARILGGGGCLVSEYLPGVGSERGHFVERDRLQSALSDALFVVETDVRAGTMHTAGFARAQGRPIACLAHPERHAGHPKTRGNALLIGRGAAPVADGAALAAFLARAAPGGQSRPSLMADHEYDVATGRAAGPLS